MEEAAAETEFLSEMTASESEGSESAVQPPSGSLYNTVVLSAASLYGDLASEVIKAVASALATAAVL